MVVRPLVGNDMDYTKLRDFSKAASLEGTDVKACISAVTQILRSSSCYAVSPNDLGQELEQLGLDRAHSQVIVKIYSNEKNEIMSRLKDKIVRFGKINEVTANIMGSSSINISLSQTDFTGKAQEMQINMSKDQAHLLLAELKAVKSRMEELQTD